MDSSQSNRFVCPNDRQLALRAKLKTGWSVKTGSLRGSYPSNSSCGSGSGGAGEDRQNQGLKPHEQDAIIAVIRRAEELDLSEQKRVGCLVERLENMRRKVVGRSSSQCLLCADTFGLLKAQKLICMDCKKAVCQKCAIDSCGNGRTRCSSKDHYLCMICSEAREIWKKSGAWFFKSIPKYILPNNDNKTTNIRKERRSRKGRNTRMRDDENTTSSSDEDWKLRIKKDSNALLEKNEIRKHATNSTISLNSTEFKCIETSPEQQQHETPSLVRKELSLSRSLNEYDSGRVSPLSTCSASTVSKNYNTSEETKCSSNSGVDLSLGTMDLSLIYDPVNATLHCTVYRAKNLIQMDINGLADPYCKLNILPCTKPSKRLRTKTIHKTRNPEFNENLTFYDISKSDLLQKRLHIIVLDEDKFGHDFMGETKIALAKLDVQNTIYLTLALENLNETRGPLVSPELSEWFDDSSTRGQILLSLCYNTKRRALIVNVIKCTELLPMDNNGYSDPFVKLTLRPDPNRKKYKTSIKRKELNPIWNEEFAFETRPTELATQSLHIAVFDKDYGKSDDYLGGLIIGGAGSKGQRLKHWLDMIRYPDHHHECWHNLSEEFIK